MKTLTDFIGIPYDLQNKKGLNCYTLVQKVSKELFNQEIPDYSCPKTLEEAYKAIEQNKIKWKKIKKPEAGAAVLLKLGKYQHIGLMISSTHFIHVLEKSNSTVESIHSFLWQKRIIGFYRYQS